MKRRVFSIVLAFSFILSVVTACSSDDSEETERRNRKRNTDNITYAEEQLDSSDYEDVLLGAWSPNYEGHIPTSEEAYHGYQPKIMEFYYDNGELCYYCYQFVLNNGNIVEFEYSYGYVVVDDEICECYRNRHPDEPAYTFDLDQIGSGLITDIEDGDVFYRISDSRISTELHQ